MENIGEISSSLLVSHHTSFQHLIYFPFRILARTYVPIRNKPSPLKQQDNEEINIMAIIRPLKKRSWLHHWFHHFKVKCLDTMQPMVKEAFGDLSSSISTILIKMDWNFLWPVIQHLHYGRL